MSHEPRSTAYMERPASWTRDAACANSAIPQWMWDSEGTAHPDAVAVCTACPVRVDCLEDAMSVGRWGDTGVRGGLGIPERAALRRSRKRRLA